MNKFKYDKKLFPFKSLIKEALNVKHLDQLHKIQTCDSILTRDKDQSTQWHRLYYNYNKDFLLLYKTFISNIIKPRYSEEKIVYQKIPTFRVHLPDNIAVGEWHKDRFYRDQKWSKYVNEQNYYLPFTDTNEYNTFWVESEEDKGDYAPALVNYGEVLEWDGANLMHGNKENKSDFTRISVDFRIIPMSRYIPSTKGSINMESKFAIGGYYDIL